MNSLWIVLWIVVVVSFLPMAIFVAMSRKQLDPSPRPSSYPGNALYVDRLIEIWPDKMVFHHYYFPTFMSKRVPMDKIERIWTESCTLRTGQWRIGGSGDGRVWFPLDFQRPQRDRIFFATLRTQKINIGFTVERPEEVEMVLKGKGFLGN